MFAQIGYEFHLLGGTQLADLVANAIGRSILNISPKPGHEVDFKVLQKKLSGNLTILPK